ncbi:reprolysin-like metallopeptidase [Tahibacter amnicola]|uniref:M12 family metallo-peptidase n=1 Tax=Tahibacter amnicola TaxID=2976241 RepID=A0ABY6BDN5_9GAMM|nr:zinc-dependent metalloprotease family protein [Tahibacter amnicola]UXI68134.1 M12 family metallo-peptidase [Tahibacter amnicola]
MGRTKHFWILACAAIGAGTYSFAVGASPSVVSDGLWQDVAEASFARDGQRVVVPNAYRTLALDTAGLKARLAQAPLESKQPVTSSPFKMTLPMPDGTFAEFRVVESPIMDAELARKYPDIHTYIGQGVTDPTATLRFDVTQKGFHGQILSADGAFYIDPYQKKDTTHYVSYARSDYSVSGKHLRCEVTDTDGVLVGTEHAGMSPVPEVSSGGTLRTYRLALAATGEYTQFHGGTVADALAGMVTTMARVNGVYERELAVRMVLVGNTDQIIYTNGNTDPYTNSSGSSLIGENQTNVDAVIGNANYDVGHIFSTGGGGLATLQSVCNTSTKARGVTGSGAPTGDAYDVDYVAHEMGHQFGGPHTFNSSVGSCGGANRSPANAYESGSGVSIMAYAGICGAENLQPNSEDYFHRASLNSILGFIGGSGGACAVSTATGNTPPVVNTPAAFSIPARTPFALTATGSDADNDTLTYLWEQFNLGAATTGGALVDDGTRPIFRGFDPVHSPVRVFPSLRYILNNANVPPTTAALPGTDAPLVYTGETLPTTSRTLNFRVTARDNRAGAGGTNEASTAVSVVSTAGPFAVTSPNTAVSWAAGSEQTVTWSVASTDAAPISTVNVRITLSLDGGYTHPVELAASVPNNGSATVTIPASTPATAQARVKVEAVGNIFFDVSDVNLAVTSAVNSAPSINVTGSVNTRQGSPAATATVATVSDTQDGAGNLSVSVSGAPPELGVSVANNGGNISLTATAACSLVTPTNVNANKVYPVLVTVTDSQGAVASALVNINVGANQVPTLGTYANQILSRNVTRSVAPTEAPADANSNYVGITVSPTTLPGGGTVSIAPNGTVTVTTDANTTFGSYKIRASATDTCGGTETHEFTAQVTVPDPLLTLGTTAVTTGNNLIEPNECNDTTVSVNNGGGGTATAVSSTLSTTTPGVTITQASSNYPDVVPGGTGMNSTAFKISTASNVACFSTIALTQTITYAGNGSPTVLNYNLPVGRAAGTNYAFTSSTGATIPAGGTLLANSNGDDVVAPFTLPADFSFSVYGTAVTGGSTISISSNGFVMFAPNGSNAWGNAMLPVAGAGGGDNGQSFPASAPTLFAFWDDLDTRPANTGVFTDITGTAPNRTLKIEWRGVLVSSAATTVNFAVLFHEGSNAFELIYNNAAAANGTAATIGVQAASTGPTFTTYSHNTNSVAPGTRLSAGFAPAVCATGTGMCGVDPDLIFRNGFDPTP